MSGLVVEPLHLRVSSDDPDLAGTVYFRADPDLCIADRARIVLGSGTNAIVIALNVDDEGFDDVRITEGTTASIEVLKQGIEALQIVLSGLRAVGRVSAEV